VWCKERDLDGTLRYVLCRERGFLPMCILSRHVGRHWNLYCVDRILNVYGSLKEAKNKAEGMLGL
jgi:hypothetical protein